MLLIRSFLTFLTLPMGREVGAAMARFARVSSILILFSFLTFLTAWSSLLKTC